MSKAERIYRFDYVDKESKEGSGGGSSDEVCIGPGQQSSLAWILSAILQPSLPVLLQDGPLRWPKPLMEHQRVGIAALLHNRELLLADEMGLGKTIQVLGALRILFYGQQIGRSLIVAPASLLRQWQSEAELWAPELTLVRVSGTPEQRSGLWRLPAHAHLVSYETLREDIRAAPVTGRAWDVVVLDEASKIKNFESQVSLAPKRIPRKRRWALTGTPLENRIDDVQSILQFLIDRVPNRDEVRGLLSQVQLRRKKGDALADLPPKTVITVPVELTGTQQEAYRAAERDGVYKLRKLGPDLKITHVLELVIRLKQICNVDPPSGHSAKFDDLTQRMQDLVEAGHRALVFSQFTDATFGVKAIAERLAKFGPLVYTGELRDAVRSKVVKSFSDHPEHKALILSLRAGGLGLNLQSASYVFHVDRWWNPAIEDQAESRSHRIGQTAPVTVYRYVCCDTIEERVDRLLEDKRELFSQTVDGVSLKLEGVLSQRELFGLFGL